MDEHGSFMFDLPVKDGIFRSYMDLYGYVTLPEGSSGSAATAGSRSLPGQVPLEGVQEGKLQCSWSRSTTRQTVSYRLSRSF